MNSDRVEVDGPFATIPPARPWTVRGLLVAIGIVAAILALLLSAVRTARDAAQVATCHGRMSQLALALRLFHDQYGTYPPLVTWSPDGKYPHSWRVLLLPVFDDPVLDQIYANYRFDEPWNSPHNAKLGATMPDWFRCSALADRETAYTSYLAVTGKGSATARTGTVAIGEVPDGADKTVLIVEATDAKIHWMEPVDLDIDTMSLRINDDARPGISSPHRSAAVVMTADGRYRSLPSSISPEELRAMLTADGGEKQSDSN